MKLHTGETATLVVVGDPILAEKIKQALNGVCVVEHYPDLADTNAWVSLFLRVTHQPDIFAVILCSMVWSKGKKTFLRMMYARVLFQPIFLLQDTDDPDRKNKLTTLVSLTEWFPENLPSPLPGIIRSIISMYSTAKYQRWIETIGPLVLQKLVKYHQSTRLGTLANILIPFLGLSEYERIRLETIIILYNLQIEALARSNATAKLDDLCPHEFKHIIEVLVFMDARFPSDMRSIYHPRDLFYPNFDVAGTSHGLDHEVIQAVILMLERQEQKDQVLELYRQEHKQE